MTRRSNKKGPRKTEKAKEGMKYVCDECGMSVTLFGVCGCPDMSDITCCGQEMRPLEPCNIC